MEKFSRLEGLIGSRIEKLYQAKALVFGVGGVGGYVIEGLARCGVGELTIVDCDVVSESNLNRQIIALTSTLGRKKTEVMKERVLDINPDCKVNAVDLFYTPEKASEFDFSYYDYVIDAVDNVTGKIDIICNCVSAGVPVITCMGTANHLDPTAFKIDDIYSSSVCPLARVMRKELSVRGIEKGKVHALYSTETPVVKAEKVLPSAVFCPSVAGMEICAFVTRRLIEK